MTRIAANRLDVLAERIRRQTGEDLGTLAARAGITWADAARPALPRRRSRGANGGHHDSAWTAAVHLLRQLRQA